MQRSLFTTRYFLPHVLVVGTICMPALALQGQELPRTLVKALQKGKIREDTSYVYALPYKQDSSYRMVQGYYSGFSHKNMVALDFKMHKGTTICAARPGVVSAVWTGDTKGGLKKEHWQYGNYVSIIHSDGSMATYFHLNPGGSLVQPGDTVQQGQPIARSGHTGYSAFPHLHFWVSQRGPAGGWRQIPVRFLTRKGPCYLKPMRRYTKP